MWSHLAVTDTRHSLLFVLELPDLTVVERVQLPFMPGTLAHQGKGWLVADAAEPLIHRVTIGDRQVPVAWAAMPEVETLLTSGGRLFALSSGTSGLLTLELSTGTPLCSSPVGNGPQGMCRLPNGRLLVAAGQAGTVLTLNELTLTVQTVTPVPGIAIAVTTLGEQALALVTTEDYEPRTLIGKVERHGAFTPWVAMQGAPGAFAACDGGVLVSHQGFLTMLEMPSGRFRFQTRLQGMCDQIVPLGRAAAFLDSVEGIIGLMELRRGAVLRRVRVSDPAHMATDA